MAVAARRGGGGGRPRMGGLADPFPTASDRDPDRDPGAAARPCRIPTRRPLDDEMSAADVVAAHQPPPLRLSHREGRPDRLTNNDCLCGSVNNACPKPTFMSAS